MANVIDLLHVMKSPRNRTLGIEEGCRVRQINVCNCTFTRSHSAHGPLAKVNYSRSFTRVAGFVEFGRLVFIQSVPFLIRIFGLRARKGWPVLSTCWRGRGRSCGWRGKEPRALWIPRRNINRDAYGLRKRPIKWREKNSRTSTKLTAVKQ